MPIHAHRLLHGRPDSRQPEQPRGDLISTEAAVYSRVFEGKKENKNKKMKKKITTQQQKPRLPILARTCSQSLGTHS